ncbi:MAG: anhydro-N-acetylmuramic acid kinase [bacterium]
MARKSGGIERLVGLAEKKSRLVVGLMSGTSLDGIDAVLARVSGCGMDTQFEIISARTYPFPEGVREEILRASSPSTGSVDTICRLNFLLGELLAEAVEKIAREADIPLSEIDLVGSHGQTVHHLPRPQDYLGHPIRSTLQIGEPSVIAKRTGIVTVADFRPADVSVGGEGAPLAPYFDYIAFRSKEKNRVLLNIGGIANVTILRKGGPLEEVRAFDTGPGNVVIDDLMARFFGRAYDEDGATARRGKVSQELLDEFMSYPFVGRRPPKSTGREEFGEGFVEGVLRRAKSLSLSAEDIVATATEFTAKSIYENCERFSGFRPDEVIVGGGGAHNLTVLSSLGSYFSESAVLRVDDFGIPSDFKEALCFAILANETICGNCANIPSATGAREPVVLGKICL